MRIVVIIPTRHKSCRFLGNQLLNSKDIINIIYKELHPNFLGKLYD